MVSLFKAIIRAIVFFVLNIGLVKRLMNPNHRAWILQRIGETKMDDRETLYRFWTQRTPVGNRPEGYVKWTNRSAALVKAMPALEADARILEVGCNVGRNLSYLVERGFKNVEGIEISPHAVELLRKTYPNLASAAVYVGPAEERLPELEDRRYDMVFTMAVLMHIHPDSHEVFRHIARVAKTYILLVERVDTHEMHRIYPHDYKRIFEGLGFRLIKEIPASELPEVAEEKAFKGKGFSFLVFERSRNGTTREV